MPHFSRIGHWLLAGLLVTLAGCATTPPEEPAADLYRVVPDMRARTNQPYVINGVTYRPLPTTEGYSEKGVASWYGADFHNRATSIGERYDMYAISAAHTILPIPCLVRVTNLQNGQQIVVRVNDRGPFVKNRIIDMSYGAAKILGFAEKGTAIVQVEAVSGVSKDLAEKNGFPVGKGAPPAPAPVVAPPAPVVVASLPVTPVKTVPVKKSPKLLVQVGAFQDQWNAQRLASRLQRFGEAKVFGAVVGNARFYRVRLAAAATVDEADQLVDRLEASGFPGAQIVVE